LPTSQPPFGDNLLGAIGGGSSTPQITLTFANPLYYIAFQVSSATDSNFTAQLLTFNALGQQLGTYQVLDTGAGGNCAGLAENPPVPCNDAPLILYYDPTGGIAQVELVMTTDASGVYIDELQTTEAPEPGSVGMVLFGLVAGGAMKSRLRTLPGDCQAMVSSCKIGAC
jgi:hypothetical protein